MTFKTQSRILQTHLYSPIFVMFVIISLELSGARKGSGGEAAEFSLFIFAVSSWESIGEIDSELV